MKKTTVFLAAVLMAVALTGILTKTIEVAYADDTSNTIKEANSNQKAIASGNANAQTCEQLNIDSHTSAGDEGVDCQLESNLPTDQTASDGEGDIG
jgi:uncharacterized protein YxeA